MKHGFSIAIIGVRLLAAGGQLAAHHSEAAVYDLSTAVTLKGVVTKVAMTNPHGSLSLAVKDAAGNSADWIVELPSAAGLAQKGVGRGTLKQGDEITVEVWVTKSGPGRATSRMVHLPSGQAISTMTPWHCTSAVQEGCDGLGHLAPAPKQ
jgi:hypothetical protein